ncbi:hypothetical protein G6F68_014985 [Rhizopus microsporus]|nr:hypothetical protein G6F68_014985 [Rhizopus microsporus]
MQPHQRAQRYAFARARFADDCQRPAGPDIEVQAVDGAEHAVVGIEINRYAAYGQQRGGRRGSSARQRGFSQRGGGAGSLVVQARQGAQGVGQLVVGVIRGGGVDERFDEALLAHFGVALDRGGAGFGGRVDHFLARLGALDHAQPCPPASCLGRDGTRG